MIFFLILGLLVTWGVYRYHEARVRKCGPLVLAGVAALALALYFVVRVLGEVFSLRGLAWSFGLGPPTEFPVAVRLLTYLLLVEGAVAVRAVVELLRGAGCGWGTAHKLLGQSIWAVMSSVADRVRGREARATHLHAVPSPDDDGDEFNVRRAAG